MPKKRTTKKPKRKTTPATSVRGKFVKAKPLSKAAAKSLKKLLALQKKLGKFKAKLRDIEISMKHSPKSTTTGGTGPRRPNRPKRR